MADIRLPLTASAVEIADAIRQVQARCRLGLCQDPDALGRTVREQLDRGERAAAVLGLGLAKLYPRLHACGRSNQLGGDDTVVTAGAEGLRVHRGAIPYGCWNGELTLHVYLPGSGPRL